MSKIFQCDRCKDVYKTNENYLLKALNNPILPSAADDWSIAYIQFFNKRFDIESLKFNLCDKCTTKLYNWMFKGKSL